MPAEASPGEKGQHAPALDAPREIAELCRARFGEGTRHAGAIGGVIPFGADGVVDERPLDAHGHQIGRESRRPAATRSSRLDVIDGERRIVEEPQRRGASERRIDRRARMPLAPEPAAEVVPRERAALERAERGAEGGLFIGRGGEPPTKLVVHGEPGRQPDSRSHFLGHRAEACSVDLHPERARTPGIGLQRGDGRERHSSSSVPAPATTA